MEPLFPQFGFLYCLNDGHEIFVVQDVLNTILVMKGIRRAYLPSKAIIAHAIVHYFSPHVKTLDYNGRPDLKFVVRADSTATPPTTHEEVGKLLGYMCADEWEHTLRMPQKVFFEFIAKLKNGSEFQLFSFVCLSDAKLAEARLLNTHVAIALLSDPLANKIVKSVVLRKGVTHVSEGAMTKVTNVINYGENKRFANAR